ncbi:hypothetical protein [Paraburkholderia sp. GAS334]|jgi:hypothetical protein|uniref:hypothetical protein n=1 Tax=Paraburkholderia sp. GAS334 TaxID=3035131 RepID=UPI003D232381
MRRNVHPREFRNIDNRRVLDDDGRQGIDGVTGLGSSSEVLCGKLLEELLDNMPFLYRERLNDCLEVLFHVRDLKSTSVTDLELDRCTVFSGSTHALSSFVEHFYQAAPWLAVFQIDDLIAWSFQLRDGFPLPTTRSIFDERL